jgi:hypothetical protein
MARTTALWLALALLAGTPGCRSRCDLVEAELRTRERQLRETQGELMRAETMNEALENTLRDRHGHPPALKPGPAAQVNDVQLGRGTGGIDEDKAPGDEGIQVVLVPRDVDGSAVKAPGLLKVTALEITPEGLKVPLSTWDVSAVQLRRSWRSGLLSTGYHVTLPWQKLPGTDRLRIVAQFLPLEGGAFEAERDVNVRVLAEASRPGAHVPLPAPHAPVVPPPVEVPTGPPPRSGPPPEPIPGPVLPGVPGQPVSRRVPAVELLIPVPAGPVP